jgi:hypothetical protein
LCYILVHNIYIYIYILTGPEPAKQVVLRAKEGVHAYSQHAASIGPYAPIHDGPPPPYSPTNLINSSPYNPDYTSHSFSSQVHSAGENSNPFSIMPQSCGSYQSPGANDDGSTRDMSDFNSPNRNPFHPDNSNRYVFKYVNKM